MTTVAFVPLKLNNERLPNKNTKPFEGGEPLLTYILRAVLNADGVDATYVYCSDDSVAPLLPAGAQFLRRSDQLDLSSTRINEVMRSFAGDVAADVYVLAHATAPFITTSSIERCVSAVASGAHDSAFTVVRQNDFVWFEGRPLNYDPISIPRTQDLEPIYVETTGLYVYTRSLIMDENRRIGDRPLPVEVSKIEAIDINEAVDFDIANAVFSFNSRKREQ
jgi:CMP-N-acetylneuraminic acid synthetase